MDKFVQLAADIGKLWGKYGASYVTGMRNTLVLALVATVIGCLIGFVCGVLNTITCAKNDPPVKRFFLGLIRVIVRVYVEVFRGTPMVLQAVFMYYGLPYFTDNAVKFTNIWVAAVLVVSVNTGAYMAESVRGGIISNDPGQTEGAKAIGMNHVQTMTCVVLPQAIRNILPAIANEFVTIIKESAICFTIGVQDIMSAVNSVKGATYRITEALVIATALYFCLTYPTSKVIAHFEKKMSAGSSRNAANVAHKRKVQAQEGTK